MTNIASSEKATASLRRFTHLTGSGQFPVGVKRILVATDLTSESKRAMDFALGLAMRFRAHLTLVHVFHESSQVQYLRGSYALEAIHEERIRFLNALKRAGSKAKERYFDCDTEFHDGEPWDEIVSAAREREIDLIVISTHHYNWLERFAYGSDADKIVRRAPCPILVVHSDEG
jgi:nucleotide-binding universal stress UspA family protein